MERQAVCHQLHHTNMTVMLHRLWATGAKCQTICHDMHTSRESLSKSQKLLQLCTQVGVFLFQGLEAARSLVLPASKLSDLALKLLSVLIVLLFSLVSHICSFQQLQVQLVVLC